MRLIPLLLVSVSLVLAGCSKEEDPGDGGGTGTTTTTPTGNATTTTPTTTTTGGGNVTTPTTPRAMELCAASKDFGPQGQPPQPPNPPPTVTTAPCGTVGAGYSQAILNVTWALATAAPLTVQSGVQIDLIDAAGTAVASCPGPAVAPQTEAPPPCTVNGAVVPGDYQLRFTGNGDLTATISVMVS